MTKESNDEVYFRTLIVSIDDNRVTIRTYVKHEGNILVDYGNKVLEEGDTHNFVVEAHKEFVN